MHEIFKTLFFLLLLFSVTYNEATNFVRDINNTYNQLSSKYKNGFNRARYRKSFFYCC